MPEHSELHKAIVTEREDESGNKLHELQKGALTTKIRESELPETTDGTSFYDQMADLLRENNDAQFNIVSTLDDKGQWVRDATKSLPLEDRIPHDHPVIEANNVLLRALSRMRAIDYAISQKYAGDPETANHLRTKLKEDLITLTDKVLDARDTDPKLFKDLEKEFDTKLIETLHEANLTKGVTTEKEAEKLLFRYRNLSSLLVPARTLVTLTYDETENVLQRETQYPVTAKSPKQKEAIESLRDLNPSPLGADKNAHTKANLAIQEVDSLFVDLMKDDERALPAQARKTHLVGGVRNAFIVENELIFDVTEENLETAKTEKAKSTDRLWLARTGVPVYVGEGESKEDIQKHTIENLEQIRRAAKQRMGKGDDDTLNMHLTTLNTYTFLENQSTMINHLYDATRRNSENDDDISYAPTNIDGTFRILDVAPSLKSKEENLPSGSAPLNKEKRVESVGKLMLKGGDEDTLSVVNCASGQDRTGTAVEKATQMWMEEQYQVKGFTTDNIETMRAKGGNAGEITSHHVHGSPGMKEESKAGNTFSQEASKQFYRASANTNKKNPVGNVGFLQRPSVLAVEEYKRNYEDYEEAIKDYALKIGDSPKENEQKLLAQARDVLKNVGNIAGEPTTIENIQQTVDSKSLSDLNSVLLHCRESLQDPTNAKTARKVAGLSKSVSGKSSSKWKALGVGLLTFACLALVVGGILAAIPSGGTSLLLTAVGATGLGVGAAAGIGGTAVVASAIGGAAAVQKGREKGLANSVSMFKKAVSEIKEGPHSSQRDEESLREPSSPSSKNF